MRTIAALEEPGLQAQACSSRAVRHARQGAQRRSFMSGLGESIKRDWTWGAGWRAHAFRRLRFMTRGRKL